MDNLLNKSKFDLRFLTRTAVIAAIYAVLTLVIMPLSYGPVQFRISEVMTILPLFYLEAVPGLTIGCFIANIFYSPWDMLFGTLASLIAALLTRVSRKIYLGVLPPILINAFVVPIIFLFMPDIATPYIINVLTVGLGQAVVVLAGGIPFYFAYKKAVIRPMQKAAEPFDTPPPSVDGDSK